MAWQVGRPEVSIKPGQNLASKAFTVETGPMKSIALYDAPDALAGIAIYVSTTQLSEGSENFPVINWSLHAGNVCVVDDEPICAGSTFLTPANFKRQGLLFQVSGRDATNWVLRAYCTKKTLDYTVLCSMTMSPIPSNAAFPSITAGTMIG